MPGEGEDAAVGEGVRGREGAGGEEGSGLGKAPGEVEECHYTFFEASRGLGPPRFFSRGVLLETRGGLIFCDILVDIFIFISIGCIIGP